MMTIEQGEKWLKGIAETMQKVIANGAAPHIERVTIRELIARFGYERRGDLINRIIRNSLERHNLIIDQDIAVGWIDSEVTISLDSDAAHAVDQPILPDSTHRIGSLESANRKPKTVQPDDSLSVATTAMMLHDYSQLPVMTSERNLNGIISWKSIGTRLALGEECECVRHCMEPAEEILSTAPLFDALTVIAEHGYVLIRGADKAISGIVTASDLSLQFRQLAGPFLFIGEIEGHLRRLIHGKFTLGALKKASEPEEQSTIEGSGDLTLGGYCRLLGNEKNWGELGLNIDRKEFVKNLDAVRKIRNDVMHFNPDGLSEEDTDKLQEMAQFLENLATLGLI